MRTKITVASALLAISVMANAASAALVTQLTGDSLLGLGDGASVATWTDTSGAGNHATQGAAASQPTLIASSEDFNGHAAVLFDGTDDWLDMVDAVTVDSFTLFVVGKFNVINSGDQYFISGQPGSGNNRLRIAEYSWSSDWRFRVGGTDYSAPAKDTNPHAFALNGTSDAWVDGDLVAGGANTSTETPLLTLGAANVGSKDYLNGEIAEVRLYDTILTTTEIEAINAELYATYVYKIPIVDVVEQFPAPNRTILTNAFPIDLGAVLVDRGSTVDAGSIELVLDGTNLTLSAGDVIKNASTTTVSHAIASLAIGTHTASLVYEVVTPASGPYTNTWSFEVRLPSPPPPICPRWAFEPWVWEDNGNTQNSTLNLVDGYKQRDIPVGVVIVDSPWETSYHSFDWDNARYQTPVDMLTQLHDEDVRVVLWITGAQNTSSSDTPENQSPYFDYIVTNGYAVNNGATFGWWKGTGTHVDFTNPDACDWYGTLLEELMDLGIDGWKVDQSAQYIPEPISTSIGSISKAEFKPYYYAALHDQTFARNPESLILARPYSHQGGYAASIDKCTLGWGGDYDGNFQGIQNQVYDLYKSAETGYGTLYVEVGGYYGAAPDKKSLIRYTQFGALMPVMSNGGSNGGLSQHLPWYWDTETVDIYRYYATLHSELAPYLFSCSVDSHLYGGSIVKSIDFNNEQHGLGEQLFTALITDTSTSRDVILPSDGAWIDYWNENQLYTSGTSLSAVPAPLDTVPLYIKAGAIIPMNVSTNLTGHGDLTSVGKDTVMVYPFGCSSYTYHRAQGGGIDYDDVAMVMDEKNGTLSITGSTNVSYRFRIKSFAAPTGVAGADSWSYDAANDYVIVDKTGSSFVLEFDGLEGYSSKATSFELWQDIYSISGSSFEGDADANGVINGYEYYLNSNPTNPLSPDRVLAWSSDYLSVMFPFNPLSTGVTSFVEWSTDLMSSNWSSQGVSYMTNTSPDEIEATVGTSITNQQFIRLMLSH